MRNIRYPNKESLDGPWLLSSKSLKELDAIIAEFWEKFELRRERLLRRFINEYKKKRFTQADRDLAEVSEEHAREMKKQIQMARKGSVWSKSKQTLEIKLKDETVCSYANFEEALRDRYLLDKRPTGFAIDLFSGDIQFYMALNSSGIHFETNKYELVLDASGTGYELSHKNMAPAYDVTESQELYTAVYGWATETRHQSRLHRFWGKIAKLGRVLLVAGIVLPILFSVVDRLFRSIDTRKELYSMYEQGITNSNVIEAVKLLILLQKNENASLDSLGTSALPAVYVGILAYLALVLFIRPKAELEIGKGRDAIQRWAIWQWLIALPAVFFIGDILRPRLVEFINFLLRFLH
jgi:hypothetical protein